MARRIALQGRTKDATLPHDTSTSTRTLSAREYYNTRYEEVDKNHPSTTLYADTTNWHIDRLEGLWRE